MDREIPKNPTNLLLLPHFVSSGVIEQDPFSRGTILGLTLSTKREELVKSILEGVSYGVRSIIEVMEEAGFNIQLMNCVGGGSKSDIWLQLKADIYGKQVNKMAINEGGCLGLVVVMAKSLGFYKNIKDAIKNMVKVVKTFYPEDDKNQEYIKRYRLFKKITQELRR